MHTSTNIKIKLARVFPKEQADILSEVINDSYSELVKTSDFNELKEIVRDLANEQRESRKDISRLDRTMQEIAELQKESRKDINRLDRTMQEIAELQKEGRKDINRLDRTMQEIAELQKESRKDINRLDCTMQEIAEAQKRTDIKIGELSDAQKQTEVEIQNLARGLNMLRVELGGLSNSMSYAFENEGYRMLPIVLKDKYGIELKEKIIRAEVGGKEINILVKGKKGKREVLVVGESKLRLDDGRKRRKDKNGGGIDIFEELDDKVRAVKEAYKEKVDIVRVLLTHYATKRFLKEAEAEGVIVVQSFEW